MNKKIISLIISICLFFIAIIAFVIYGNRANHQLDFDAQRAFQDLIFQVGLGPRIIGSQAHRNVLDWLETELNAADWILERQLFEWNDTPLQNLIAKRGKGPGWTILGAHFDTRFVADRDLDSQLQKQPGPGANDGASGVAVLLELARVLPQDFDQQVWLVFFDAEDNGNLPGWDWILGSKAFVSTLTGKPDAVVIVDMVGDSDLNLFYENNSDPDLSAEIWQKAQALGFTQFIQQPKRTILDDHVPFLKAGIPAVDIIDLDYPFWHTTQDTVDKLSADSLEAVGETLLHWLLSKSE